MMDFVTDNKFKTVDESGNKMVWYYPSFIGTGTDSDRDDYCEEVHVIEATWCHVASYWDAEWLVNEYAKDGTTAKVVTNMDIGSPSQISYTMNGADDGWHDERR